MLQYSGQLALKTALPPISGDVTLASTAPDRPGLTFVGNEPLLRVVSGSVTLSNLYFGNSSISNAPVISNAGTLRILNCYISQNRAQGQATQGGVIYSEGRLVIEESHVVANLSTGKEGEFRSGGVGGHGWGGAIHLSGGDCHIFSSEFLQNRSEGGLGTVYYWGGARGPGGHAAGGAIYAANSQLAIRQTRFWRNTSVGSTPTGHSWGGALYATNSQVRIESSAFIENGAQGSSNSWTGKIVVSGGKPAGGGVYSQFSDTRLFDSVVRLNWAVNPPGVNDPQYASEAGGIMVQGEPIYLEGCTVAENFAAEAKDIRGFIKTPLSIRRTDEGIEVRWAANFLSHAEASAALGPEARWAAPAQVASGQHSIIQADAMAPSRFFRLRPE